MIVQIFKWSRDDRIDIFNRLVMSDQLQYILGALIQLCYGPIKTSSSNVNKQKEEEEQIITSPSQLYNMYSSSNITDQRKKDEKEITIINEKITINNQTEIPDSNKLVAKSSSKLTFEQIQNSTQLLHSLIDRNTNNNLVVASLMELISSINGNTSPKWMQKVTSTLLSRILLKEKGGKKQNYLFCTYERRHNKCISKYLKN